MVVSVGRYTVNDLLMMLIDGLRRELKRGEQFETPPNGDRHGAVVMNLLILLAVPIKWVGLSIVLAENGVIISRGPATVLAPDAVVKLGASTAARDLPNSYGNRLPDIVFEVVSPSDSSPAVRAKLRTYVEAGIPMAIAAWPDREGVTVATADGRWVELTTTDTLDWSDVVLGLTIPVSEIFD